MVCKALLCLRLDFSTIDVVNECLVFYIQNELCFVLSLFSLHMTMFFLLF